MQRYTLFRPAIDPIPNRKTAIVPKTGKRDPSWCNSGVFAGIATPFCSLCDNLADTGRGILGWICYKVNISRELKK
ncbi:hypothetical protein [Methylomonas koyamae]|uniref:hypothetical protein n=1 Tax=Methylomonas koyamae TaxID=702114 RepID=UPI00112DAF2D|nr:hypothetical protein [Methylomonas koyamae]TPQ25299.1 hypothetical protein C2U68_15870 [Methylomonas koyamae]